MAGTLGIFTFPHPIYYHLEIRIGERLQTWPNMTPAYDLCLLRDSFIWTREWQRNSIPSPPLFHSPPHLPPLLKAVSSCRLAEVMAAIYITWFTSPTVLYFVHVSARWRYVRNLASPHLAHSTTTPNLDAKLHEIFTEFQGAHYGIVALSVLTEGGRKLLHPIVHIPG